MTSLATMVDVRHAVGKAWTVAAWALVSLASMAGCTPVVGSTTDPGPETPDTLVRATPAAVFAPIDVVVGDGDARLERFDPPGAGDALEATIDVTYVNPNTFDVRLRSVTVALDLADDTVYEERLEVDLLLPGGGSVDDVLAVSVPSPRAPATIVAVASAFVGEPLTWRLRGPMAFTAGGFRFDVADRTWAEGVIVPTSTLTIPAFTVGDGGVTTYALRPGTTVVDVAVDVTNAGDIGTFLVGRDVTLSIDDVPIAVSDVGPVPLPAGATRSLVWSFPYDLGAATDEAASAWERWTAGSEVRVTLTGAMTVDVLGVASIPLAGWRIDLPPR